MTCHATTSRMNSRIGGPELRSTLTSRDGLATGAGRAFGADALERRSRVVERSVLPVRFGVGAQQRHDLADDPSVLRIGADLGNARMRQRYRYLGHDPTGAGAHHQD